MSSTYILLIRFEPSIMRAAAYALCLLALTKLKSMMILKVHI